jgi:hypothetical protein
MRTLTEKSLIMARAPCVQSPVKCPPSAEFHQAPSSELRVPSHSRYPPRCPSVVLWTPCRGCGVGGVRTDHQPWRSARRASSLRTWRWSVRRSPCPSCPTTHPPYVPRPSAVDHLDRDMLQRLTCSRTATSCVWCPMCTSGVLRTERGWVTAVNGALQWIWFGRQPP